MYYSQDTRLCGAGSTFLKKRARARAEFGPQPAVRQPWCTRPSPLHCGSSRPSPSPPNARLLSLGDDDIGVFDGWRGYVMTSSCLQQDEVIVPSTYLLLASTMISSLYCPCPGFVKGGALLRATVTHGPLLDVRSDDVLGKTSNNTFFISTAVMDVFVLTYLLAARVQFCFLLCCLSCCLLCPQQRRGFVFQFDSPSWRQRHPLHRF